MTDLAAKLSKLKRINLSNLHPNLWIIQRTYKKDHSAVYVPMFVKIEEKLRKRLHKIVEKQITRANHVEPYEYLNADQDIDTAFTISTKGTDLELILNKIREGSEGKQVQRTSDMFNAWAYAIHLTNGRNEIVAVRKISEGWKLKQVKEYLQVVFHNQILIDLDEEAVFRLDSQIDFFSFEESIFILNKKNFERALNFRKGMEHSRNFVISELVNLNIIDSSQILNNAIGDKLTHLRRIAQIKKNAYYKQPNFLENCKKICKERKWSVEFNGTQMVVTSDNFNLVLRLLNQDRLTSLTTDQDFDVDVKRKVA